MKRLLVLLAATAAMTAVAAKAKVAAPKRKAPPSISAKAVKDPVESRYRKSPYVGAIALDAASSNVVFEVNADQPAYPASVTKLMTALLVLEDVDAGKYSLDDKVIATADVYRSEPSWIGLKVGDQMSVGDLLTALMVESANDAAIALAVNSAGSLEAFTARMNERSLALGMKQTTYYNPNGLPPKGKKYPWKSFNVTTARDQSKLALALVSRPDIFRFTSVKTCDLVKTVKGFRVSVTRRANGGEAAETEIGADEKLVTSMKNHNNIMRTDKLKIVNADGREAVDGLKTGYIDAGGSSIILTGVKNGKRAIVVVLGSMSSEMRDTEARKLLLDALASSCL